MIDIDDIDFEERTIRIRGKGDKIRTVFVDEETLIEIDHFIGPRIQDPSSRDSRANTSPRGRYSIYSRGMPLSESHRIRSGISYASELYKRSKNLRVVQENLGHSSIKTTEVYLHTDLEERKRVYEEYFPLSETREEPGKERKSGNKPHDAI